MSTTDGAYMQRFTTSLSVACLVLFGCNDIVPTEGMWFSSDLAVTMDDCNFGSPMEWEKSVDITVGVDNTFILKLDVDTPLDCTSKGRRFDCGPTTWNSSNSGGFVTEETYTYSASGKFNESDSMDITVTTDYDCSGEDCEAKIQPLGIDTPCSYETAGLFLAQN